jgi:glycosyltransferase involved in cell wall biosynthesis
MKRSFIVYTNNSEKYIGRLLESIIDQMNDEIEQLIIIDDMSTDNTVPIIVETLNFLLTDEDHYKFYINSYVKGKRKSIEVGKEVATGDFKFIINKKKRIKL